MAREFWDVIVVGSGPAGSSAAIAALRADPSAKVLLLDRHDFPRDKCCGDAVLGRAFELLGEHGVDTAALLNGFRPTHRLALVSAGGATVARSTRDSTVVLPRLVFDDRLRSAAIAAGAQWRRATVRRVDDAGTHVDLDDGLRARVVIGADGAESVVRRAVGPAPRAQVAIALRAYATEPAEDVPRLVFDRRGGLAYAWSFPSDDGRVNVGYGHLLRPGETSSREALTSAMHRLLPDVRPDPATQLVHRLPLSTSRQPVARGRLLLAGDAASLINPLTGEGIYYAISSGLVAGRAAVRPDRAAAEHAQRIRASYRRHHRHVALMSALSGRAMLQEAALRAAADSQGVFDDLAALGLAGGTITARMGVGIARALLPSRTVNPAH